MKRYLIILLVALLTVMLISVRCCQSYRRERDRLADNQRTLMSRIDFYKTKDSLSAASVERLTLSNDEFREYCKDLEGQVKKLGLKVKRLQSVSQTATITEYPVKTIIRDSIIPGKTDTLRCINFQNAYLTLSGCFESSHFNGLVENRDTIIQVVHRVPHRFWFIRWGTKAIRQEVISRNPYSRITYTEYIELKK